MTDETKKLFDAPWEIRPCDVGYDIVSAYNSIAEDRIFVAHADSKSTANRIARMPELYDALLHCICTSCNVCIYDHCGSPVDCEQLLSQECTYEDSKLCFEHEVRELLKKVRDGE